MKMTIRSKHNKTIRNARLLLLSSFIFLLLIGCKQPTEFNLEPNLLTPEDVVENLVIAYQKKDLRLYLSSFVNHCIFFDNEKALWGFETEKRIHEKMFEQANILNVKMRHLESKEVIENIMKSTYSYYLDLQLGDEPSTKAEGEVVIEFFKKEDNSWQITSFRERKSEASKVSNLILTTHDSVDYFPLRLNNSWTFEELFIPNIPDVEFSVTDSINLKGNRYYQVENLGFPLFSNFVRTDSLHQLRFFFEDDSTDRIVFNLAAEVGDSLIFTPPNATEIMVVELISHKDSLAVPAGAFSNVLEFLITDFNSGSRFLYEFAANIGIIRQRGTNQVLALKSAFVNGKRYPIITSVEASYSSWTQIKNRFR